MNILFISKRKQIVDSGSAWPTHGALVLLSFGVVAGGWQAAAAPGPTGLATSTSSPDNSPLALRTFEVPVLREPVGDCARDLSITPCQWVGDRAVAIATVLNLLPKDEWLDSNGAEISDLGECSFVQPALLATLRVDEVILQSGEGLLVVNEEIEVLIPARIAKQLSPSPSLNPETRELLWRGGGVDLVGAQIVVPLAVQGENWFAPTAFAFLISGGVVEPLSAAEEPCGNGVAEVFDALESLSEVAIALEVCALEPSNILDAEDYTSQSICFLPAEHAGAGYECGNDTDCEMHNYQRCVEGVCLQFDAPDPYEHAQGEASITVMPRGSTRTAQTGDRSTD